MSVIVLTRPENAVSAVRLGYPVVNDRAHAPAGSVVIRWGCSDGADMQRWAAVLNKAQTLALSTNKLEALQAMSRVVSTPKIYSCGEPLPRGHRYVTRPANHSEGSDFNVIEGGQRLNVDHATEYLEDTREYRVWFVRGNYLVAKRVPRSSEGQSLSDLCRSKWGYSFVTTPFPKLVAEMAKARQAIPLDFGAVDVLWKDGEDGQEGKWYFLEFNSAPSLDHDRVLAHFRSNIATIVASLPTVGRSETHLQPILRDFEARVVPEVQPARESAPNRPVARPTAILEEVPNTWEGRFEARLRAERKAKEEEIRKRVYND